MLTDAAIRSAVPGDKAVKLFDGGGLYLELAPSGGKWWRLKYRYGGVEKRISLGTYPRTGLKAARQARDQAKKLLDGGSDPSASRKAAKATLRRAQQLKVEAVALAWLKHRAGAWKDGTRQMIEASLRNDLFPKLGRGRSVRCSRVRCAISCRRSRSVARERPPGVSFSVSGQSTDTQSRMT